MAKIDIFKESIIVDSFINSNIDERIKKILQEEKNNNEGNIITNVKEISTFFSSIYLNSLLVVSLEIAMQISILIMLWRRGLRIRRNYLVTDCTTLLLELNWVI